VEFFNKKQDVIELKLTQFGRHLLSAGRLKPTYYAFFDDNVIYDLNKTDANVTISEQQNTAQERIKETQLVKSQVSFSSLQKEYDDAGDHYSSVENAYDNFQKSAEKNYLLPRPIGTSKMNSNFSPAWNVNFLKGFISSSAPSLVLSSSHGGKNELNIPQLFSHMQVDVFSNDADSANGSLPSDEQLEVVFDLENSEEIVDSDNLFFLLKIEEQNSEFQKKNFDIEMFEVEEEYTNDGIKLNETIRPLVFAPTTIDNLQALEAKNILADENYADYYFDLLVDDEIDDAVICQYDPIRQKMGVFADERAKTCEEVEKEESERVFDIYDDESDFPGEIC
tara:strand:+ start:652 stop:1662 length:1011 start_codon:yes stop_codon:yes gene_type:complete